MIFPELGTARECSYMFLSIKIVLLIQKGWTVFLSTNIWYVAFFPNLILMNNVQRMEHCVLSSSDFRYQDPEALEATLYSTDVKLCWKEWNAFSVFPGRQAYVPLCSHYSVLWKNQVGLMCLISPKSILSIYVKSVKSWASTVGVCKSNSVVPHHYLVILFTRTAQWDVDWDFVNSSVFRIKPTLYFISSEENSSNGGAKQIFCKLANSTRWQKAWLLPRSWANFVA
jgi:hypothetical protein